MSNKILKFNDFKTGGKLSDPKTATSVKAADPVKKEKSIDQVKRADLTHPKITLPDYSKVAKTPIQESSADTQAQIDIINQTKALRDQVAAAATDAEKIQLLAKIKQIEQQAEQKAKAAKVA
jgi:hypothetical protein